MNPLALQGLERLRRDLPLYASSCLSILDMEGKARKLTFNDAQVAAHVAMEEQRKRTGKVRAIILKGRKQGLSTMVGARFYHRTSMNPGIAAQVLAHVDSSSQALFRMVRRYHLGNPLAPQTSADSTKELIFSKLDSRYQVSTAGSRNIGRGDTVQLLHCSEFGFWGSANEQMAAIDNMVADVPGTEIIIESTANGIGNLFADTWNSAIDGGSDFIPIFIPWMWERRYEAEIPEGFALNEDERAYQEQYSTPKCPITLPKMAWRRNKIKRYGTGFEWLFDQEFPAVPELAFQTGTSDPLVPPGFVAAAMNSGYMDADGPVVIGCDPAGDGDDRTAIVWRRGRVVLRCETYLQMDRMQVVGLLANYWANGLENGLRPDAIVIDKGGEGSGIYSRLRELNIPVVGIMFGQRADEDDLYANKRAEMWFRMRDWLEDAPVRLPPNMALSSDLSAPQAKVFESNGRRALEKKSDMKKRGVKSPDLGDALALTFAVSVAPRHQSSISVASGHKAVGRGGY